nr:OST-HTH/LOTUS domain-containing protein [uncultured Pseudomonas sp.]
MDKQVNEGLAALQGVVSQKMGRCILRLQQVELLTKAMLSYSSIEGPAEELSANLEKRKKALANKTLGQLTGEFVGSYVRPLENDDTPEDLSKDPTSCYFRMSWCVQLESDDYANLKGALSSLVALRNDLVHHFVERFDVFSLDGCTAAITHLDAAFTEIDTQDRALRAMAKAMDEVRQEVGAFLASEAGNDMLVYGITPGDAPMHWPATTIVQWLQNAEPACAINGWTRLTDAIRYIEQRNQGLTPRKYGCTTWRQVVHESKLFQTERRREQQASGSALWYRSKPQL